MVPRRRAFLRRPCIRSASLRAQVIGEVQPPSASAREDSSRARRRVARDRREDREAAVGGVGQVSLLAGCWGRGGSVVDGVIGSS